MPDWRVRFSGIENFVVVNNQATEEDARREATGSVQRTHPHITEADITECTRLNEPVAGGGSRRRPIIVQTDEEDEDTEDDESESSDDDDNEITPPKS